MFALLLFWLSFLFGLQLSNQWCLTFSYSTKKHVRRQLQPAPIYFARWMFTRTNYNSGLGFLSLSRFKAGDPPTSSGRR
jgi:hypothetical protein